MVAYTLIPALGRQRQADHCEFKASLVYIQSELQASWSYRETFSQKQQPISQSINENNHCLSSPFPKFLSDSPRPVCA